ncbi:MAG: hypothetical protein JSR33_03585 [Proteobacteria bacterium]|nr:hypothetical protein [Pseudomonadota bacterium]
MKKLIYLSIGLLTFALNTYASSSNYAQPTIYVSIYNRDPASSDDADEHHSLHYDREGTFSCVYFNPIANKIEPGNGTEVSMTYDKSDSVSSCYEGSTVPNGHFNFTYHYNKSGSDVFCTIDGVSPNGGTWNKPTVYYGGGVLCKVTTLDSSNSSYQVDICPSTNLGPCQN